MKLGNNRNFNEIATVTRVTISSVTATTLALPNDKRIYLSFCLAFGTLDVDAAIRAYPASQDNNLDGEMLTRHTIGNANLFRPSWIIPPDNQMIGEFSGLSAPGAGDVDIIVTEW